MEGHWSAPSLEQALELVRGILPREYESWEEVQGWHGDLMPTPTSGDAKGSRNATGAENWDRPADHHGGTTLTDAITLLPTPNAQESDPTEEFIEEMEGNFDPGARMYLPGRKWHAQRTLSRVAALLPSKLLPTPAAWDGDRGPDYARMGRPDSGGDDLVTSMARMLPTPQARDGQHSRGADPERYRGTKSQGGRRVNLDDMIAATEAGRWSGEPTGLRSPATPSSSGDVPLTLWTEEDD